MSEDARATVTEYNDGDFVRTAIVVPEKGQSFDLVDEEGTRIAEINAFVYYDNATLDHIIVDVIDKDELFTKKRALVFNEGIRHDLTAGHLVSADFRERK